MNCPRCQSELPINASTCSACGLSFDDATQVLEEREQSSKRVKQSASSFPSLDDARFVPGTMLVERYRIVGLLGKGGMGEVYRADDLKLGQPVALKFLPDNLLSDGAALARFHREVRVARQVSHKNVCRVYDIGEVDGHQFLSMEYIKGEELSSLLRRIGRLPQDKAVQLARQICAGLAAAHDAGVLHRDLKPANIMIDAEGNARILDFGLAGLEQEFREDEAYAGTPAYMAPEQLNGQPSTARSDIYSLGLVLYELFTSKRAFEAENFHELVKLRRSDATPTTPSKIVTDIDPLIEKIIERCLKKDPDQRPASALQVAAALPGGDPLAAALAAGETPSPEMVAAAPKAGALKPPIAIACLTLSVALLALLVTFSGRAKLDQNLPLEKPPEVLAERAREIITSAGYPERSLDEAYGFDTPAYNRYARELAQQNLSWELVKTGQPLTYYFWFRQSPRYLVPDSPLSSSVSASDPATDIPGMTNIVLDVRGRLVRFDRLPPEVDEGPFGKNADSPRPSADWSKLFAAAGLVATNYKLAQSSWVPPMFADERVAWEGFHPDHSEIPIRIEGAAFKGQPVHFQIIAPWDEARRQKSQTFFSAQKAAGIIIAVLFFGVIFGAALLSRHNLRLGRSDKKGAFKVALFVFLAWLAAGLINAHHVPSASGELTILFLITAFSLCTGAFIWLIYIALEPHLRKRSPRLIISWSRLMAGDFRDPLVGRDLLIGGLFGLAHTTAIYLALFLARGFGFPAPPANSTNPLALQGLRGVLVLFLGSLSSGVVVDSIILSFAFLFLLLLLQLIFRHDHLAAVGMWLVLVLLETLLFGSVGPQFFWVSSVLIATLTAVNASRFGLLSTISQLIVFYLTFLYPITTDLSVWYASAAVFPLVMVLALAIYGFYVSLGGQPVLKGSTE